MTVNLKSVFNFTKAVQKYMLKQKYGSIINMSSVVGVSVVMPDNQIIQHQKQELLVLQNQLRRELRFTKYPLQCYCSRFYYYRNDRQTA
ncbi:MAG: SDR family NAD(P)-dependent oxidoreductase [Marinilabiliales bacterium]|nr:SDR family NAD(P)-dependent oxidoreductase [Marinilabiliales bacterium]